MNIIDAKTGAPVIRMHAACAECGRIFDLADPIDAEEYTYGHDCEDI